MRIKNNILFIFWIGLVCIIFLMFIFYSIPTETKYKYPNGIYCVPNEGLIYFGSNQVPNGAILIKPNPDYTNGEYTNSLNINFLKMMGCVK